MLKINIILNFVYLQLIWKVGYAVWEFFHETSS